MHARCGAAGRAQLAAIRTHSTPSLARRTHIIGQVGGVRVLGAIGIEQGRFGCLSAGLCGSQVQWCAERQDGKRKNALGPSWFHAA